MAHGFFVARRSVATSSSSRRMTNTREVRIAWSTPRSETADDQCPGPYSRVSVSAAAIRSDAIAAASSAVASTSLDTRGLSLGPVWNIRAGGRETIASWPRSGKSSGAPALQRQFRERQLQLGGKLLSCNPVPKP